MDTDFVVVKTESKELIVVRQFAAPGPPGPPGDIPLTFEMETSLLRYYPEAYREIIYANGLLVQVNIWSSIEKLLQVLTRTFIYDPVSGLISQITITHMTGAILVKTIIRDSTNRIITTTRNFTPAQG